MPRLVELPGGGSGPAADALMRLAEAEDTLRAIAAGEVDAFVVSSETGQRRVFTLATADRVYRMFVENMRDGGATVSAAGIVLYANRRLAELLGCSRAAIMGAPLARFVAHESTANIDVLLGSGGRGTTLEAELVATTGVAVPVSVGSSPIEVSGETLLCLTFTDLTAQKAQTREIARLGEAQADRLAELQSAQAELTEQATHDALTHLPNRSLLTSLIDTALAQSRRSDACTAVLFIDLDRFKQVNDTQGHAAGDAVLRKVGERLKAVLRPMDTVARIGGDEFAVLAPNVLSHLEAADISARLVEEVARCVSRREDRGQIGASVGIAVTVGGRSTAERMLHQADTAMYKAKSLGGGRAELFDQALGREVQGRANAQKTLRSALDARRVVAHYQPIITLETGRTAGFEALARILAADGEIVPPSAFIPIAETSGLVVPLGEQVLQLACREATGWSGEDEGPTIAVNLSARQFDSGDLTATVERCLRETGLQPGRLHLELTETAIMDLRPEVLKQLAGLRALGVEVGLDDFGTGYASLTHLRRLPLTFVKIDQTFVQGLGTESGDERIVAAVVDLSANLGLRSVGEGVETVEQLAWLRELGCDQGQGYLFARPLPAEHVGATLAHAPW